MGTGSGYCAGGKVVILTVVADRRGIYLHYLTSVLKDGATKMSSLRDEEERELMIKQCRGMRRKQNERMKEMITPPQTDEVS